MENYTETTTNCREYGSGKARGHYYCSGVLVRTVNDGDFEPWIYSPTALGIGATSYSWMRTDVNISGLYHPAGFILRNRIDAVAHDLPGLESGFVCVYPFDASTSTSNGKKAAVAEVSARKKPQSSAPKMIIRSMPGDPAKA